jgi:hypothetical protein
LTSPPIFIEATLVHVVALSTNEAVEALRLSCSQQEQGWGAAAAAAPAPFLCAKISKTHSSSTYQYNVVGVQHQHAPRYDEQYDGLSSRQSAMHFKSAHSVFYLEQVFPFAAPMLSDQVLDADTKVHHVLEVLQTPFPRRSISRAWPLLEPPHCRGGLVYIKRKN